jgi:hypothetical protein
VSEVEGMRIVGTPPALPWPLKNWNWFNRPERAERLAAFRIGVALVLLWDILFAYWPLAHAFFGRNSLGDPAIFTRPTSDWVRWTAFRGIGDATAFQLILTSWAAAALCLLLGIVPRVAAAWCWLCSISIMGVNYYLHNSGDNVRTIALFYLAITPCGAVWTLPRWLRKRASEPTYVQGWPLHLLLIQLATIYFVNGAYKMTSNQWQSGVLMHYVMGNLAWTRISYAMLPLPLPLLQLQTWIVLLWEACFPLLIILPRTRTPALLLGILFHVGTGVLLQIGAFPLYMICLYLPLAPWEKWFPTAVEKAASLERSGAAVAEWSLQQAVTKQEPVTTNAAV